MRIATLDSRNVRVVRGSVVALAGPFRAFGGWWGFDAWARDDWDLELNDGALYRVYRDLMSETWFVEGTYD